MSEPEPPADGPPLDAFTGAFYVYEVRSNGDAIKYYGEPLVGHEQLLRELWPAFHEAGYDLRIASERGRYVVVAEPKGAGVDGVPWTNVLLFLATVASTLLAGAGWYGVAVLENPTAILRAWPFTAAVLGVLVVHELGHYVAGRYYGVDVSLPYFIPFPTILGTAGAVIRMRGRMPNRKALFDIGVAGPLAGLAATIVVTVIGLHLDPVLTVDPAGGDPDQMLIRLNHPPLLDVIAVLVGQAGRSNYHPVVVGGWVGMFITFLNMLPVGQFDGGHVSRAMLGDYQETIAAAVPGLLVALTAYLHYARGVPLHSLGVWVLWSVLVLLAALAGPVQPIDDSPLGRKRILIGAVTFLLAALCFTPVPIEIIE